MLHSLIRLVTCMKSQNRSIESPLLRRYKQHGETYQIGITRRTVTDYYVLQSDQIRITYTGGCCPHCGGNDPLFWCMT